MVGAIECPLAEEMDRGEDGVFEVLGMLLSGFELAGNRGAGATLCFGRSAVRYGGSIFLIGQDLQACEGGGWSKAAPEGVAPR